MKFSITTSACTASRRTSAWPFRSLEIGGDRALAAIAGMEIGGAEIAAVAAGDEGRTPVARVVARLRAFDLDNIGAEIGEQLPAPRTGEDAGEFENAQARERRPIAGLGQTTCIIRRVDPILGS